MSELARDIEPAEILLSVNNIEVSTTKLFWFCVA